MKLLLQRCIFFTLGITPILTQAQVNGDYQSRVTGNWNVATTWQIRSAGSWITASTPPSAGTTNIVTILNTHTVTVTGTQACGGALAVANTGILAFDNASPGTLTVGGNLSGGGTVNMSGGSLVHTLNLGGTNNAIGTFTTAAVASTVNYANTGNQQIFASANYRNLTISGSGTKTLQGAATVNNLNVAAGTMEVAANSLTVAGTSNIAGSFSDNNSTGTNTFTGKVTVASSGTFFTSFNSPFTFTGGIQNDGAFNQTGTGANTFNASQLLTGSKPMAFAGAVTIGNGFTLTNQNTKPVTIGGVLNGGNGTSTWLNDANAILDYKNTAQPMVTGGLNANTGNPNTVIYSGGNQTVDPNTYRNLTLSGSGSKTLIGVVTVNKDLSVSGAATLASDIYQITGNATGDFTMDAGTTLSLGRTTNTTDVLFPTAFITANITLDPASTIIYQNNSTQTVSATPSAYGNLTIATGGTKTLQGNTSVSGNLSVTAGTFNLGTTATTFPVAGTADIDGTLDFGLTTTKVVNIGSDLSGAGTVNMSGGSLLHTLNLGGANNAITTFTTAAVASTVNYTDTGNQQIFTSANYRNLTVSGSGTKTLQGTSTVNGNLSVSGTATLASDNKQITGTAGGLLTLGAGTTLSLGNTGNNTNVLFPVNFTTANISLHPSSTVIYQNNSTQTVSATPAAYGNLTIDGGGTKNLAATTTVNGMLTLNNGLLSPGAFDLVLGPTATTAGSFSATAMILSGGGNVIKKYDAFGLGPITLPFGTTGVYTPATFNLTGATLGGVAGSRSVVIKPVVGAPATQLDATYSLNKHWIVSTPNLTNLTADLSFTYAPAEANATAEPGYVSAYSLVTPTVTPMTWVTNTGTVNTGTNTISFTNFTNAGSLSNSTWTAAPPTAFVPGTFYSIANGNYEANTTWSLVGYGGAVSPTPPATGSSVYIGNNRTVTMTAGSKNINVVQIDATGTLDLSTFTGINVVTFNTATTAGTAGTLKLSSATWPTVSGTNNFLNTAGNTVEYGGVGSYALPASPTTYQNLTISGGGTKTGIALTVNGTFTVNTATYSTAANTILNGSFANTGTFTQTANTTTFGAASAQNLGGASNNTTFYNLTLSGGSAKSTTGGNIAVTNVLNLNNAILSIGAANLTLGTGATVTGTFNSSSMIQSGGGNVIKQYSFPATGTFTFPVGTTGAYTPATINLTAATVGGTGSISLRPVATAAANQLDATYSLAKHWAVTSTNLSAITATLAFTYVAAEANATAEPLYVPAYWNTTTWTTGSTTGISGRVISFTRTAVANLNGLWTAGPPAAYSPGNFYSIANANYELASTWSNTGYLTGSSVLPPLNGSNVFVGNGKTVTVTAGTKTINTLQIDATGTLDLASYTGITVGTFAAQAGTLRMSAPAAGTAVYPTVTTDNFRTTAGSTVEYYGGSSFTLPATPASYQNLIISGTGTKTMTGTALGAYPAANLTVNGNLTLSTSLVFGGTNLRRLVLAGNLAASTGTIDMAGFAHELYLGGANNDLASLYTGATTSPLVNYNRVGNQQVFASFATSNVGTGYKNVSMTGGNTKTLQGNTSFYGTLTVAANTTMAFGASPVILYVGGDLVAANTGTVINMQNAAHALFLYGTSNVLTTLATDNATGTASTINYSRYLGSAQSVFASANYRNLALSGNGTKTLQGATTANTLNIAGGTLEVAAQNLTVSTTSTISDVFSDNTSTGTNTFVGNVTVTSTGSLTTSANSPFVFQGGLTNNGTINTTGTGAVTFSGNQTINGSAAINMAGAATVASGFTVDNQNSALTFPSLTVSANGKFKNSFATFPASYAGFSNGSAMTNKFTSMLASNNAGNAVTGNSTTLALTRNGNGSVYALRGLPNFSPVATALVVNFDLSVATSANTPTAATLLLGGSSNLTDDATLNGATARVQVNLVNSNTFTLTFPDGTVTTTANFDNTSTRTVTWVINTTGAALSYVGPDGTTASALANNTADVWVGATRHAGLSVQNAAQAMNQLKAVMSAGTGTITFSNLSVNPLGTVNASPVTCNNALYITPFVGATLNVSFSTPGTMTSATHFNSSNTFTAQLSNASGSFASATTIGTLTTTALSGVIPCSIPSANAGTVAGTGYRIRVVSSAPISVSPDNGTNLSIGSYTVSPYAAQSVTTSSAGVVLTASGPNVTAGGYQWGYYTVLGGAITDLAGKTAATYTPNGADFPGAGIYALICRMTTSPGCVATSNEVIMYVNCANPSNTNLIQNGDFTLGNTGFTTGYAYVTDIAGVQDELNPEGKYAVGNNPNDYHTAFCSMTSNTQRSPISGGNMLIGNAATTGSIDLWKQTVTVTPNTDYVLSFYATSLAGATNSLFFGIYAGCFRTGADVSVPFQVNNCTWNKYSFQLSSGSSSTTVDLAIRNISAAASGNDIAIDDIQFYPCDQVSSPPFPIADTYTWRGITNDWFTADNWGSSCGVPTCGSDVTIPVLGTDKLYPVINAGGAIAGSLTVSSGASLTINSGFNLDVCGDFINSGIVNANSNSTVTFTGNKNPQLVQGTLSGTNKLDGLIMNKTNATDVLRLVNPVDVANNLTLTKGSLDANGKAVKVGGNFSNAATFTPNGNTVEFNGTGNQQYTQTGTGSFHNLIVNNSSASNTLTLNPTATTTTVANKLTLTRGIVVVPSGKELSLTSNADTAIATGFSASSYVFGNLRRAVSGVKRYSFPLGDATRYELIEVNVTGNLVGTSNILGFFTSTAPGGSAPAFTDSGNNYLYTCGPGYWTLSPNAQPSAGTFDLLINPVGMPCTGFQQTIAKRTTNADPWGTYGSTAVSTTRRNGYTSFSEVVQTSGDLISLPVRLLTFEGKLREREVFLSWTTASEMNNEYFEVQRSADLKNFEAIGQVNGAGTTSERRTYQFTDKKPLSGVNYYRLHQVDINGQPTNSHSIAIESATDREKVYLYPNPVAKDQVARLRIDHPKEGSYQVQLYDLKGIELFREVIQVNQSTHEMVLPCKDLPSGVYLVRLVGLNLSKGNVQWNLKLVVE